MGAFSYIGPEMAQGAQNDLAYRRQLQDSQRQQKLEILQNAYGQTTDQKQRDSILQGIDTLYPTPAHAPQFLQDLLHIHGRQQQDQQNAQTTQTPPPAAPVANDPLGVSYGGLSTPAAVPKNVAQVAQAPNAQDALKAITQVPSPAETAINTQTRAAQNAQTIEGQRAKSAEEVARIRTQGNAAMQKLDAAAQSLGEDSFATATPENKIAAMKALHAANVTQSWKAVQQGNDIYAADAHDPTKPMTLIGHKDDLTTHLEYQTLTNADGSTYKVPMVVWTKKGSSKPIITTPQDLGSTGSPDLAEPKALVAPQSPVSAQTPQGVPGQQAAPNPGARAPGTRPQGGAVKQPPQSAATPSGPSGLPKGAIPFGSKGSPLLKSDAAQYTKVAEDANGAQEAFNAIAPLYGPNATQQPSPSSDQELIYAWVRSNVAGAGRMTQAEFKQGAQIGSFGQKVQNWLSLASTGKLSPQLEQMLYNDVARGATTKQAAATGMRNQVNQEMQPGAKAAPQSSMTPAGPAEFKVPPDAPPAPKQDGKVLRNKANGQIIAKSLGGQWVAP